MRFGEKARRRALLCLCLNLVVASCAMTRNSQSGNSGGGLISPIHGRPSGPGTIEVVGYTLSPNDQVPDSAVGYAVPIFTNRDQAAKFCDIFLSRVTFAGPLTSATPLTVKSYGQSVEVAPFVWPVVQWTQDDPADCKLMAERYNISGARLFFKAAQKAIRENGGQPPDYLTAGPLIMTVRRTSDVVMLYDMSQAPVEEYGNWLTRAVEQLSNPSIGNTTYVTPNWRDKARYYIFAAVPSFKGIIEYVVPGYKEAHDKA